MKASKIKLPSCPGRDGGFTIVEFLIAVILAGIVTSAALAIYVTQNKQILVQDDVSGMQANIRAAAVELAAQIRMAGYNVPPGVTKMEGYDTNPDTIIVTFDSGVLQDVQIEHEMSHPAAELRCDGHDISGIHNGDWIFIYDPGAETGEFFEATRVQHESGLIRHDNMPLSKAYPAGSRVLKLNRFKYFIDYSDSLHPSMILNATGLGDQVCASDISDLNIQYVLESGVIVNVFPSADMVREVIIQLDARKSRRDHEFRTLFRTRDLTARARTRNLGTG